MVFHVTYHQIQDYNIQHVHGSTPQAYKVRRSYHKIRGSKVFSDLCVSTGIGQRIIPVKSKHQQAPAFRTFSSDEVENVVNRLYKNSSPKRRQSLPVVEKGQHTSKDSEKRHHLSNDEQIKLNARLMQPTVSAKIRLATLKTKPSESLPEVIRNSCDRLYTTPSERYHPSCYENISQHNFSYRYWNGSATTF